MQEGRLLYKSATKKLPDEYVISGIERNVGLIVVRGSSMQQQGLVSHSQSFAYLGN